MITYNQETPILFIVFNRPDTTARVFEQIRKAAPKRLYIAADGPRFDAEIDICRSVREVASNVDWECSVFKHLDNSWDHQYAYLNLIKSSLSSNKESDYLMIYVKLKPRWLNE